MQKERFTVSISTENNIGLLNRVTSIFLKRHINIESINASQSEIKNIHRFTIKVSTTEVAIKKIITQLEKQIEVIRAFYHRESDIFSKEIAMYKISTENLYNNELRAIIKRNHATIEEIEQEFFVVELTGSGEETSRLYDELYPFGLMQFVRSGRVAITKPKMMISTIIK